jgi:hypothetical protein
MSGAWVEATSGNARPGIAIAIRATQLPTQARILAGQRKLIKRLLTVLRESARLP